MFVVLIGLSIVLAKDDMKFRNLHQKRFSRNAEHTLNLRSLIGKLVDTETNTVYSVDGHRQHETPWNSGTTTSATPSAPNAPPNPEEIACLAACQSCVEEYPIGVRKKKAEDNCGPMCDCADSCFRIPVQQVGKIYGQNSNTEYGRECWWRVYTEMLSNDMISSS